MCIRDRSLSLILSKLRYIIEPETGRDVRTKLSKLQLVCGFIHTTQKIKIRITFYKTLAVAVLMSECRSWALTGKIIN